MPKRKSPKRWVADNPPTLSWLSTTTGATPNRHSSSAAASPAGPPPTTMTFIASRYFSVSDLMSRCYQLSRHAGIRRDITCRQATQSPRLHEPEPAEQPQRRPYWQRVAKVVHDQCRVEHGVEPDMTRQRQGDEQLATPLQ